MIQVTTSKQLKILAGGVTQSCSKLADREARNVTSLSKKIVGHYVQLTISS